MKPYEELTWRGKLRRFRLLAAHALQQYDIELQRFDLIGYDTNILYRIYAADGSQYALRLANGQWRTMNDAQSEATWLQALAQDTQIPVPRIVSARNGDSVITPQIQGMPSGGHAILMSWLPGVLMGKRLTEQNLVKMGKLFGQLHQHGVSWKPPSGFTTRRFDNFLSRGEEDLFLTDQYTALYAPETTQILRLIREQVEATYAALDPADLRVIHCDLWHDNIKIDKGVLYPFDFEDTIWGYRLHDIAMAMLDLYEDTEDMERYEQLLTAFRRGDEEYLAWPEGDMTLLQIGRILWRLNHYVRWAPEEWLKKDAAFNADLFRRYLETGKLIPPLQTPR
ncbi:phosphotransferase [Chloroflexi bacterium TSY]|nr:phosphotransferase [Chloroflexi bacterium TSY]